MARGMKVFGYWAILAVVILSPVLLTGCSIWDEFWSTKPCDSWLSDTTGGAKFCAGQRFGE